MNYPAPKTLFSEYGPGSNTKLIKIDHRASEISGGMQGICRGWRSRNLRALRVTPGTAQRLVAQLRIVS
jgi:hypothetical protein